MTFTRYINLHTHRPTGSDNTIEIVNIEVTDNKLNTLPEYCSLGIHPWNVPKNTPIDNLNQSANNKQVIAIGETGLDKLRGGTFEQQMELFKKHIDLSETIHKPLILHCVKYFNEIITLRRELKPHQAWIFHGFNASLQTMKQAAKHGFYFSYGSTLTNFRSKAFTTIKKTPLDRLFFETDDSTESIQNIYIKASQIIGIQSSDLMNITNSNFNLLFK